MNRKLSFTVADGPIHWRTHRIIELCDYLSDHVLEPMYARAGLGWNRRFMNFFTCDNGCDPLEPVGAILFNVPPLFAGQAGQLENAIRLELSRLKIKTGPFVYGHLTGRQAGTRIQIPITENPTALMAPPDVNMSQTRGCLVLRDLLGYQRVNDRYEFSPDDLVQRLTSVTEERIAACTASPVNGAEGVRRVPSAVSIRAVRRCLEEVRQFAQWAIRHQYRRLAAA